MTKQDYRTIKIESIIDVLICILALVLILQTRVWYLILAIFSIFLIISKLKIDTIISQYIVRKDIDLKIIKKLKKL